MLASYTDGSVVLVVAINAGTSLIGLYVLPMVPVEVAAHAVSLIGARVTREVALAADWARCSGVNIIIVGLALALITDQLTI